MSARPARSKLNAPALPGRQQGVAIITALLIVALAVTISVNISTQLQLDIRRTGNMVAQDQAGFYIQVGEYYARSILKKDKEDSKTDSLDEDWAQVLPALPIDNGTIQGTITDLGACLNLNALFDAKGDVDKLMQERLTRVLSAARASLDTSAREQSNPTVQAILDWIDTDLQTRNPDGAEDGYYLNLPQPYHTANTPMQSLSELRLIKGFDNADLYRSLQGSLCAYPPGEKPNSINVNTASKEVLKSLSANLTDQLAEEIISRRADQPFKDLKDFTSFKQLKTIIQNTGGISFSSETFLLRTQATLGNANLVVYSILRRDAAGETSVIARSQRTL